MSFAPPPTSSPRNVAVVGGVVALHVAALWALQSGLLQRAAEIVVPVVIQTELLTEQPQVAPPPPAPPPPVVKPVPPPPRKAPAPKPLPPAPQPVARPDPTPSPNAPQATATPQPPAPPIAAPVAPAPPAPAPAPPAPPAPARVELPSSDAAYLQNPKPSYPPISKRLGETGKVLLRVTVGADGVPQRAEVVTSSGFDRLDQASVAAVLKWRFVPGKRAGVPEAMSVNVPINWVLE